MNKVILLADINGKIPNLALMKLSSWHKAQGDSVFLNSSPTRPDKVYVSSLFTWSKPETDRIVQLYPDIEVEVGGSGVDLKKTLPPEVEAMRPDFELYRPEDIYARISKGVRSRETTMKKALDIANAGIGRTTSGCVRACAFCLVPEKEGPLRQVAEIKDLLNPKSNRLILLDNNLTCDPGAAEKLKYCIDHNIVLDITQGVDIRLMNDELAKLMARVKHWRSYHYSWDLMKSESTVMNGIRILKKYMPSWKQMCFILVGYNTSHEEDMYRVERLQAEGICAYAMVYNKQGDARTRHFARWVNGRFHKVVPFERYEPWIKTQRQGSLLVEAEMAA